MNLQYRSCFYIYEGNNLWKGAHKEGKVKKKKCNRNTNQQ